MANGVVSLIPKWVVKLRDKIGNRSISGIGDGTVTGALYQINNDLTASDNLKFEFSYDQATGKHGYLDTQGTFVPFKNPTGNKSITISNTGTTSGIDVADYATASITTSGLYKPSGTRSITSNGTYDVTSYASASVSVSASLSETTLWTNSSPTSSQSGATLTLDSGYFSSYDYIKFYFHNSNTNNTECNILMKYSDFANADGTEGYARVMGCVSISNGVRARSVTYVSSNQFKLTGGNLFFYSGNTQSSNLVMILTKITGLR